MRFPILIAVAWLGLAACGGPPPPVVEPPPIPPVAAIPRPPAPPELFPAPYDADRIRAVVGALARVRWTIEVPGQPTTLREFALRDPNEEFVLVSEHEYRGETASGSSTFRWGWERLEAATRFPADRTSIAEESITVPGGTYACRVYTVRGDGGVVTRYAFADVLTALPVRLTRERAGVVELTSSFVGSTPAEPEPPATSSPAP